MTAPPTRCATWFGPEDASLFGVLDHPADGRARAGVVIVPSLGIEQVTTYRGARYLSERLAHEGLVTLRYDHPGTGTSIGEQLSDTAWQEWVQGVSTAVEFIRSLGVRDVTVVGIRAGCLIADAAFSSQHIRGARLVHWDPPQSGRRWLREQTTGYRLAVGVDGSDPGVSVPGGHFSESATRCLRSATWSPGTPVRLVAARPALLTDQALTPLSGACTTIVELTQADLFTAPPAFVHHVPEPDVEVLVSHLIGLVGHGTVSLTLEPRTRAVVGRREDGSVVVEDLAEVTDRGLHLFTTRVDGENAIGGIVFQTTALEPAWGPTRAWVESSRENAGGGLACFRFDRSGGGEAGRIEPGEIAVLYSHQSRRDSLDVLDSLGIPARNLLMVGLCSGAWMAAESAIRLRASAVLLFGMIQWSREREPVTRELMDSLGYDAATLTPSGGESVRSRIKPLVRRWLPYRAWEALGRRGITQVPGPLLSDLWDAGVRTTLGLTPEDDGHFTTQRGEEGLRRLRRRGYPGRIERIASPRGDHNLYRPDTRAAARRLVRREADILRESLGVPLAGDEHPRLRALFVNENIGGHATVHAALRRVLDEHPDVEAEFLHARGPGVVGRILRAPIPVLDRLDLDLQPLRGQLVHSWSVNRRVRDRLRRGDIDALHLYTQNCMLGGHRILRETPTVITTDSTGLLNAHSIPYREPTRFTRISSRAALPWERAVLGSAHRVQANSVLARESLISDDYGTPAESVTLIEMGIWSPHLSVPPPARPDGRRPTIVFLGTSMERKGGTLLLEVWRSRFRGRADLLLITHDRVPEEPGLQVVTDLSPGDDRLWELLAGSDLMCFPSVIDQAPNAVLEAAAAGLPVIAHPGGAIPEMVVDGETGLLVDGADPDAVASALDVLLTDPGLRQRMGRAASRRVREHYSIVRTADQIVSALQDAVDGAREKVCR